MAKKKKLEPESTTLPCGHTQEDHDVHHYDERDGCISDIERERESTNGSSDEEE